MAKHLYEILGIKADATNEQIKKAYRKLALQWHPDKHAGGDTQFKEISHAYSILVDETKRKAYDAGQINDQGQQVSAEPKSKPQAQRSAHESTHNTQHPRNSRPEHAHPEPHFANVPRPRPQAQRTTSDSSHDAHSAHAYAPRPQSNHYRFYQPNPAHFYFFASHNDVLAFQPLRVTRIPSFFYVASSPLDRLFMNIHAHLAKPSVNRRHNADEDTCYHHRAEGNQPEHVFVSTGYAPRMERVLDNLIANMILLELVTRHMHTQHEPAATHHSFGR